MVAPDPSHEKAYQENTLGDTTSVGEPYDEYDTPEDRRLMRKIDLQCVIFISWDCRSSFIQPLTSTHAVVLAELLGSVSSGNMAKIIIAHHFTSVRISEMRSEHFVYLVSCADSFQGSTDLRR